MGSEVPLFSDLTRRAFLATSATLIASPTTMFGFETPLAPPDKQPPDLELPKPVKKKVGYAVVGLGKLSVEEILPAFAQCKSARVSALVSGHPDKAEQLAEVYGVPRKSIYNYENYDDLADNPDVDAIYIVLPNSMHAEYTIRGFQAGKHVLCEKPMAVHVDECERMIAAAKQANKKLMIAYRLRYEPFNMNAIEICQSEKLGKLQLMSGSNGQSVQAPNIRLSKEFGGGPVGDVGVYCINAFRYLSGEEPVEVSASADSTPDDPRFREVPESVTFTLRFPSGLLAMGNCSFGSAPIRHYLVKGANGSLEMENAYAYYGQRLYVSEGQNKTDLQFKPVDHFAAEMDHFAECVLRNQEPRTPGEEGLADQRIIVAIEEACRTGKTVPL